MAIFYKDSGYATDLVKTGHVTTGVAALASHHDDFTITLQAAT
ncbi:hypothetical protein ACFRCI_18350 [Streptomyces sp. NPDC056638]